MSRTKVQLVSNIVGNVSGGASFTGIVTAAGGFSGSITGTASTASFATTSFGLSGSPNIAIGNLTGVAATFTGNVSIAGTLTYEDVTNVDSVGLITARTGIVVSAGGITVAGVTTVAAGSTSAPSITPTGDSNTGIFFPSADTVCIAEGGTEVVRINSSSNTGIGTNNPTSKLHVVGGDSRFNGVVETVSAATTYMNGSALVVEMDVRNATTYTYTIPTGANIGIVSFKNMPAETGNASGTTITLITTQNSAGTGNTTAATGIGTNCTVIPFSNGAAIAGISTRGLVGSATTVTLSTTASDVDFVSFFVHYTGGTNTAASSYKVYTTKNGGFARGTIGV